MPPQRPKPPKETRAEIEARFLAAMGRKWPVSHQEPTRFLMGYFTSLDLIGITAELEDPDAPVNN